MDREKILQDLQSKQDIIADEYDGSYELVREVVASYATLDDYSDINFFDMNAIYLMAIGTWRINVERKKEKIALGCLPQNEKDRLCQVLDKVWDNACKAKYEHKDAGQNKPIVGMFGTGFQSFEKKTTDECARKFVEMLVDIVRIGAENEDAVFDRAEKVINSNFKGMKAASASVVLHCLMPTVFPVLNGNMGNGNIFSALGIDIDKPAEIGTYIANARKIKAFRDANLPFKNYRIMDIMAWDLPKYDTDGYFPTLDEYDPGISSETYIEIFQNESLISKEKLDTLYYMYLMGGEATCKQIELKYGGIYAHYNSNAITTARVVKNYTNCPQSPRDEGGDRLWAILFQGRDTRKGEDGGFLWRLRPELSAAIAELDEAGFFEGMIMKNNKTDFDHNTILYGPPGTGKTYNSKTYAVAICDEKSVEELIDYAAVIKRYDELTKEGRIQFTTFHQSYGYEEFIEGIKPVVDEGASEVGYTIEPGVFKKFCERASAEEKQDLQRLGDSDTKDDKKYVFIIDEINRGNISKIFGELITLIEDTKRAGMPEAAGATLPYSGEWFSVPSNVYLLGTMNTADRSIALMDTALRRRFSFVEMPSRPELLDNVVVSDNGILVNIGQMLRSINKRITHLYDREHTIGHAPFMKLVDDPSVEKLAGIFAKSVIPLLQEYFYEDYSKIRAVLGDNAKIDEKDQFVVEKTLSWDDDFLGNQSDTIDIPEHVYEIKYENLSNIRCYKGITERL